MCGSDGRWSAERLRLCAAGAVEVLATPSISTDEDQDALPARVGWLSNDGLDWGGG